MSHLNPEQHAAASTPLGYNLIIASAGTGKTSTIVARIENLLNSAIKPEKILLLTFTNKAAQEMINRLCARFDKEIIKQITAGTFHSVCNSLLKKLGKELVLKQPSELKTLLKSIAERRQFHHLSDLNPYGGAYLYDVYSLFNNTCVDGENFASWFSQKYGDQSVFADIYEDILREFEEEKLRFHYVDFNDLLIKTRDELRNGADVEFDEILVDEYQDTNLLQSSLIDAFKAKSLFCVGDFDQSIYAFNGANIGIIGSFKDRYPDARIHALNINYRSSDKIINLANKVIANNPRLYPKQLKVAREGNFDAPKLLIYNDIKDEYANIAEIISRGIYDRNDVAIIFRNNSSADGIEIALKEHFIKCKRKGGVGFFESREIKALIDIIGLFANPRDVMAFIHVFEYAKGVGSAKAKEIFEMLLNLGGGDILKGILDPDKSANLHKKRAKNYELGLFDDFETAPSSRFGNLGFAPEFAAHPVLDYGGLSDDGARFLSDFWQLASSVKRDKNAFSVVNLTLNSALFDKIATELSLKRATRKNGTIDKELAAGVKEKIRFKTLNLAQMSKQYSDLTSFYNFLTLGKNEMDEGEGVNLLTVHASKGLEFGLVFVVDLAQNRFPNAKLMSMGGSLEEERRLFYVAVTRAKDELYLTYAMHDNIRKIDYKPSIFLQEAGLIKDTKTL